MRDGRQRAQLVAGAVGAAGLIVMWGSAVALSASPDPSAPVGSPTASPTPAPSASPTPAPTASPSPSQAPQPTPTASPRAFDCEESFARVDGNEHIVRGEMVRVGYEGYAPGSEVTLVFVDFSDMVERPIGQGTAARDGTGRIAGVVPPDSTIGQAELQIVSGECWSHVYFVVIGSPETMRVDDATVVPGQRVTVTARGFQPDSRAFITIDTYPTQGECWPHPCRQLGTFAQSSEDGTVVIHIRIPSDVTPGVHGLFATGYSPDGISDYTVGTQITVVPTGTLPPTDTEEAA